MRGVARVPASQRALTAARVAAFAVPRSRPRRRARRWTSSRNARGLKEHNEKQLRAGCFLDSACASTRAPHGVGGRLAGGRDRFARHSFGVERPCPGLVKLNAWLGLVCRATSAKTLCEETCLDKFFQPSFNVYPALLVAATHEASKEEGRARHRPARHRPARHRPDRRRPCPPVQAQPGGGGGGP